MNLSNYQLKSRVTLLLFFGLFFISFRNAVAQGDYMHHRVNLKFDYAQMMGPNSDDETVHSFRFTLSKVFFKNIEMAGYVGITPFEVFTITGTNGMWTEGTTSYSVYPSYGFAVNYHLIPWLVKQSDFRLDFYPGFRFGAYDILTKDNQWPSSMHVTDFSFYMGANFRITKKMGAFAELGKYYSYHQSRQYAAYPLFNAGLSRIIRS